MAAAMAVGLVATPIRGENGERTLLEGDRCRADNALERPEAEVRGPDDDVHFPDVEVRFPGLGRMPPEGAGSDPKAESRIPDTGVAGTDPVSPDPEGRPGRAGSAKVSSNEDKCPGCPGSVSSHRLWSARGRHDGILTHRAWHGLGGCALDTGECRRDIILCLRDQHGR